MIYNLDLEKQFIAGLIQYPDKYFEVAEFTDEKDFYTGEKGESTLHKNLFLIIKGCIEESGTADEVVISTRAAELGVSTNEDVKILDYIEGLSFRPVSPNKVTSIAKELKKLTVRREIYESSRQTALAMKNISPEATFEDIVNKADEMFNKRISVFENASEKPENIFEEMEALIEERGNNPIKIEGFEGPHNKINQIYGSILRPGNITVVVARSGVGKTNWLLDYATKTSNMNDNVPILHLDNGEMSKEELLMRQCSAMSGVPLHLLETGEWRKAGEEIVDKVRAVWKKIKNGEKVIQNLYYFNVAGKSVDQMISIVRRFYYTTIGRGNKMILAFDYFKTTGQQQKGMSEWAVVGEMVDKFKQLIHKEILVDKKPLISMMSCVQANRSGIVTNKDSSNVIDDESIVSLSDRIIQFCSHLMILRKKTNDEIARDSRDFGTHKVIFLKYRHLGKDIAGALEDVEIEGKPMQNAIHFMVKNFAFSECGDTRDLKKRLDASIEFEEKDFNEKDDLPM